MSTNIKRKKMKCACCNKTEKEVDEKVVRWFCSNCIVTGKYLAFKINEANK